MLSISTARAKDSLPEKAPRRLKGVEVQRVFASTWQPPHPDNPINWHYRKTIDGDITTSWGTGRAFVPGVDWIQFSFDRYITLHKLSIAIGVQLSPRSLLSFKENGRPQEITLSFSDGSEQTIFLANEMGMQEIEIRPVYTRWVKMTIQKIYPGNPNNEFTQDFGIAEVEFYAEEDPLAGLSAFPEALLSPPVSP